MNLLKFPVFLIAITLATSTTLAAVMNSDIGENLADIIMSTMSPKAGRHHEGGEDSFSSAVKTIDAATTEFAKSVAEAAPALSPVLTAGAVSYVAYVALSMAVPSTVKSLGLPSLDEESPDFSNVGRSFTGSGATSLVERLTSTFFQNIFRKTEFAGTLMEAANNVVSGSVSLIKSFTKLMRQVLHRLSKRTESLTAGLNSVCVRKYVCKAGHVTGSNFPLVGMLLRNMRSHTEDEFTHALIDGATDGKCNEIFNACSW